MLKRADKVTMQIAPQPNASASVPPAYVAKGADVQAVRPALLDIHNRKIELPARVPEEARIEGLPGPS